MFAVVELLICEVIWQIEGNYHKVKLLLFGIEMFGYRFEFNYCDLL